ncbi:MAG: hypothetical protein PQJ60_10105 [Spirochaetales bacterium]|nr:hypothetical protein [Spirochaetales bacterium]
MINDLPTWLPFVGIFSLLLFLSALITLPLIVGALPRDIFLRKGKKKLVHPVGAFFLFLVRNLLGGVLFLMGVVMLFIPGQGLLTMLCGLILMKFPGKSFLTHRLLALPSLQSGLNFLRRKRGREPFFFPSRESRFQDVD